MKKSITPLYLAPQVRAIELYFERGFEASLENPETDPEIDW
ncbi:MAG: hypothetical protein ACI35M_04995 [Alistipes sp.]